MSWSWKMVNSYFGDFDAHNVLIFHIFIIFYFNLVTIKLQC